MPYMTSNRGSVSGLGWFGSSTKGAVLYQGFGSLAELRKAKALGVDKNSRIAKALEIMGTMAKQGKTAEQIETWFYANVPKLYQTEVLTQMRLIQAEARLAAIEKQQAAKPPPTPTQTAVTLQPKAIIPPAAVSTTPSAPEPAVATVLPPGATGPTGAPGPVWTPDEAPEPDVAWGTIGFVGMGLAGLGILVYAMSRKKKR